MMKKNKNKKRKRKRTRKRKLFEECLVERGRGKNDGGVQVFFPQAYQKAK